MNDRIAARLAELRTELAEGRRMAAGLEARQAEVTATLLRIEGAITVLEELAEEQAAAPTVAARAS